MSGSGRGRALAFDGVDRALVPDKSLFSTSTHASSVVEGSTGLRAYIIVRREMRMTCCTLSARAGPTARSNRIATVGRRGYMLSASASWCCWKRMFPAHGASQNAHGLASSALTVRGAGSRNVEWGRVSRSHRWWISSSVKRWARVNEGIDAHSGEAEDSC